LSRAPKAEIADRAPTGELAGGREPILVVEDDPSVLVMTVDLLGGLGYQVISATGPEEALRILESEAEIDLLFSDVVMLGGVSGFELARRALSVRPKLKVLLTSGFTAGRDGTTDAFPLLEKPYETSALARELRRLLGAAPRRRRREAREVASSAAVS
jgi:CheY-like chemotaxis protein